MGAEAEQLHAVFAIDPSRRVVVVLGGDLGDQAYLVRSGPCTAVVPRHGGSPHPAKFYGFTCRSVREASRPAFIMRARPGKNTANRANRSAPWSRKCRTD